MIDYELRKKIGESWKADENHRRMKAGILNDLYEGAITRHVEYRIKEEIKDPKERREISARILEIELVKRIVDKLSRAYYDNPIRRLVNGNPQDQELFDWYLSKINFNELGTRFDKNNNNFKEFLIKPYFHLATMLPRIKLCDPFNYIVVNTDKQDSSIPNIIVEYYGKNEQKEDLLICQSDDELWIQNINGDLASDEMNAIDNIDGYNIYGKLSYVYGRKACSSVMPYPDDSMINISTLIPILCGDINYAIKYMSYAMIWGRNIKEELIKRGPSAFLNLLAADENSPVQPEIGVIKPDIDIKEVYESILMQLQLWLNSRGISASVINSQAGSISSGISKMIDEADVSAIITGNQEAYKKAEYELFQFIMFHGHEVWKLQNPTMPQGSFSPDCYVEITFPKVETLKPRSEVLNEAILELKESLISRKRAIKRINPTMSDQEIDELIVEIKEDKETSNVDDTIDINNKDVAMEDMSMEDIMEY